MGQFQRSFCTPLVGSAVVVHFYLAKCFLESRVWPEIVQIVTQDEFISIIMSRAGKVLVMELSNHARCTILPIFRSVLLRKVKASSLEYLSLSGADCFVLHMLSDNLPPHPLMDQFLIEMSKRTVMKNDLDHMDNHNQNLLKSTTAL